MIHNYMEEIVKEHLDQMLVKPECENICKCELCRDDMMAYALNKLKPVYATSLKGKVFSTFNNVYDVQSRMDVYSAIMAAIKQVSQHCNHDFLE